MKIDHQQTVSEGSFFIEDGGNKPALLSYKMTDDIMNIFRTEVAPSLRGKNISHQLTEAAVIFARIHKLKINPLCSIAKGIFKNEFKDVLI